jgi:hypothetical protein
MSATQTFFTLLLLVLLAISHSLYSLQVLNTKLGARVGSNCRIRGRGHNHPRILCMSNNDKDMIKAKRFLEKTEKRKEGKIQRKLDAQAVRVEAQNGPKSSSGNSDLTGANFARQTVWGQVSFFTLNL